MITVGFKRDRATEALAKWEMKAWVNRADVVSMKDELTSF